MGRTRIAQAVIKDLIEKKETSKQRKNKLIDYIKRLNQAHINKKVSGAQYVETLHKKTNGRDIREWVDYYENYSNNCEKEIKKQKKKIIKSKIPVFFFSIVLASIFIYISFFTGIIDMNFTGFGIREQEQDFSQNLSLILNENTIYEWQLENIGKLKYARVNGLIEGEGEVKIYLDSLLILDSSKIKSERSILTGGVIDESGNGIITNTDKSTSELTISNSETEAPPKEESSPSQGELLPENNQTNSQESITQNETEVQENITSTDMQNETENIIKIFKSICEETCDVEGLNLSKSSYTLRIEITNAKLQLDTINYSIIPKEIISEGNIILENSTINTIQYEAVLGQSVKWKKEISLNESGSLIVELPKEAENIVVNKIIESNSEIEAPSKEESSPSQGELLPENKETAKFSMTGQAISNEGQKKKPFRNFFKNIFSSITGRTINIDEQKEIIQVSINDNATNYEIEYETPASYAIEENLTNGKRVKIVGPETIHYENVLAFTNLNENLNIKNPSEIKIHWIENNTYITPTKVEDTNNNGIYDYIEWIAPHLSNQTFEIIVITKAEHLDSNRNFISDIYEQVKSLDNIWSETIPDGDYVRTTFEIPLDNTRDITLYPRVISGTPKIEVYEIDGTTKIAEFNPINSNEYNKIYLTNLQDIQDIFDLRIVGGIVEFDYIVDPDTDPIITYDGAYTVYTFKANGTFVPPAGVTNATALIVGGGGGGGSRHGGGGGGGGLIYNNSYAINGSNITVVVGAGGSRGWYAQSIGCVAIGSGCPGGNSTFGNLIAIGGGGGRTYGGGNANGGSGGGGAGMQSTAPGIGTAGQGNNGGTGCANPSAGGGGGAGSVGIGCTSNNGGNGGNGSNYSINGTNVYYSGGGGGGGESGYVGGTGGIGGGGHGGNLGSDNGGANGTANTGGGGGGTRSILATEPGFFGGSGIVIVRFLTSSSKVYPIFSDYKDDSGTLFDNGIGWFNVTIENTNGTVLLEINNTNITATNLTTNVYNASYNFTNSGVYTYRWHSWGNGTNQDYNKSDDRIYTVNVTVDLSPPIMNLISPIDYTNSSSIVNFTCTMSDVGGLKNSTLYGNWSGGWNANETQTISGLINSTSFTKTIPSGKYIWNCYSCDAIIPSNCGFSNANKTFTVDTVSPLISIIYPTHYSNFSYKNVSVNYTVSDNTQLQTCWYTNSSGAINYSIPGCANLTTKIWSEGTNNVIIYANDSAGNTNSSSVLFIVDTKTYPKISFINITPQNGTTTTNTSIPINVSISESNLQEVKYNWNGTNFTMYDDSLVLMYNFDNLSALGETSTNIVDISKYGNNGTFIGGAIYNSSGKYKTGAQLDGTNYISTNYVQTEITNYTIAIWIKTNTSTGVIVQDRGSGTGVSLTLAIHPLCGTTGCTGASAGIPAIGVDSDSIWRGLNGNKRVDDGNWHYIVGVFNSTAGQTITGTSTFFSIYIDGVFSNGAAGDQIGTPVSPLTGLGGTIIGYSQSWTQYFTSQLDELRIWNRSLSANEIYEQYVSNLNKFNLTQWYLYVNQSKNSTTGLDNGIYTYQAFAKNADRSNNQTEQRTINIIRLDSPPTYSQNSTNNTVAGVSTNFSIFVEDDFALNPNGQYIFSTNNTGSWINESAVNFTSTPSWANVTKTLNSTIGTLVGYRWYFNDSAGNRNSTTIYILNTTSSNVPPQIYSVTSIPSVTLIEGPSPTFVIVNFSVYDSNEASNLNNASAAINLTKAGEDLRANSSCAVKDFSGNYANYTCNVTMWWWDAAGTNWKVYANISDLESNLAVNDTTIFTVNTLMGFVMSPSALTFSSLTSGSTNQTPTNYFTFNNTGNVDIGVGNVEINATDLVGETSKDKFLWASNFSASIYTGGNIECNITASATAMMNKTFTKISNTILSAGNYTKNDGTGQEKVYICLRQVGVELTQQQYSTNQNGQWTIRIVLVAISIRRRKKKKNSCNSENVIIPSTIFSKELGALESLTKYMKENLGMSYHKISGLLNRDERTIWTAYNKSIAKQKEIIQIKETNIFIPISVLSNRKLTVLESLVLYLKQKNMKYSEIAKLLNRNQKNILTIYSRIANSLNEKEITGVTNIKVELNIPITIFSNKIGALETISKYLKENLGMSYNEIAELLNRDNKTIWTSYNKAIEKQKEIIHVKETDILLPASIFIDRKYTPLESIIIFLKKYKMKYSEIAKLLNRNQRNIWTTYSRTIKKDNNNI